MSTIPASAKNNESVAIASLWKPDMLKLWHYRIGHRNARDIIDMSNKQLVDGINLNGTFERSPCSDCAFTRRSVNHFRSQERIDLKRWWMFCTAAFVDHCP
jgi:hypothetical protein